MQTKVTDRHKQTKIRTETKTKTCRLIARNIHTDREKDKRKQPDIDT